MAFGIGRVGRIPLCSGLAMWRKALVVTQNSRVIHYLCYYGELFGRNARAEYNVLAGPNGAAQLL